MQATTHMSEKGQVVIPKAIRERLKLITGDRFEVVERPDGVLLKKQTQKSGRSFDEITASIRARVNYDGPPVSGDDMKNAIARMWAEGGPRWDK